MNRMPREIADSDDELDYVPPPKLKHTNIIGNNARDSSTLNGDQLDPVLATDFDQFLSPTQRLSSYDGNHESPNDISTSKFLDSSTNRFLEALAPSSDTPSQHISYATPASQSSASEMGGKRSKEKAAVRGSADKKRSRTHIEEDGTIAQESQSAKKRAKTTRGSSTTSSMKPQDASDFQAVMHENMDNATNNQHDDGDLRNDTIARFSEMVSVDARTDYTSPLDLSLHLSPTRGPQIEDHANPATANVAGSGEYAPRRLYQPQGSFFGAGLRGVTTSNSSMGNYQSFSINPERLGMDFDKINPFGSLSQVSLPGDLDSEETRGIADIFRNSASYSTKATSVNEAELRNNVVPDIEHDMQTSPIKSDERSRASGIQQTEQSEAQCSPPFSPITNPDDQKGASDVGVSRQRRGQESIERLDDSAARPAPKKRGRKPKYSKPVDTTEPGQNDADELHTDGQPSDRTVRAGTIDSVSNMSEISQATNDSQKGKKRKVKKSDMVPPDVQSKKLPSSDLGLDNQAIIGLSPERYVPRPSRRRGQAEPQTFDSSEMKSAQAEEPTVSADEVPSKAVPAKDKKGKKSKSKGSKTSRSALAKHQDDLVTEDTKDGVDEAVYIDEVATSIAPQALLEHTPDQAVKNETTGNEEGEDVDEEVTRSSHRRTKISVDIPIFAKSDDQQDLPPPVAEPKKRGRKRKKPVGEEHIQISDDGTARTALSEKDPNVQAGKHEINKSLEDEDVCQENMDSTNNKKDEMEEEKEQVSTHDTKATMVVTPSKLVSTPSLKPMSSTPLFNARARIGLSKRHSIPSLLRKVDRNKEAPKAIEKKEKLTKRQLEEKEQERIAKEEAEAEGREYKPLDQLRGKDGLLVEWDF